MRKNVLLLPNILNVQIIDSTGKQCGKVSDIELQGELGKELTIKALLVGVNAWHGTKKGSIRVFLRAISRNPQNISIPWKYVKDIFPYIQLSVSAEEVGLCKRENSVKKWLEKIPGGK